MPNPYAKPYPTPVRPQNAPAGVSYSNFGWADWAEPAPRSASRCLAPAELVAGWWNVHRADAAGASHPAGSGPGRARRTAAERTTPANPYANVGVQNMGTQNMGAHPG
jgi:hypothetical protein